MNRATFPGIIMPINKQHDRDDDSTEGWTEIPQSLQYLRPWAASFGMRGLTVYHGGLPSLNRLATQEELLELSRAYDAISERGEGPEITRWCRSVPSESVLNEVKEEIRGLLLLFERLAEYGLSPFTDGHVRYSAPAPKTFNWSLLPPGLRNWEPWLRKFEGLRTEHDLFEYVQRANAVQLCELAALCDQLGASGEQLSEWCTRTNRKGNPAGDEAFQAEWLFLLGDFAQSRINS